ncbi:MAG: molybdopterin molybdotransferase MoeA [Rhodocyclaceae bacterium]|nr:molybdopterin molybdotransferase MoeA [Rhodocyclaceae bacterium]
MDEPMLSYEQALQQLLAAARPLETTEQVALEVALGRILAAPQVSSISVPPLNNSAMDGYAVRCADIPAAGTTLTVSQRIPAGSIGHTLAAGTAARIFTGAPVPEGADAVVMQELCRHSGDKVAIDHLPRSGENIRRAGEDIAAGQEVLAAGALLTPQALGLLASIGVARVPVLRRLRVALFSTGDELVQPGEALRPGAIYNSNRYLLRGLLEQCGCIVTDLGIVADKLDATRASLRDGAAKCDVILTSGGVSVGEEDHVKAAVKAEGELDLWKIAIKPGKPLAFGRVGNAAFVGLPGNPVAAFVTFLVLVRPFLRRCQGSAERAPQAQMLPAGFDWLRGDPRREFLRVRVENGQLMPFRHQGSGVLASAVWSDGLAIIEPEQTVRNGDPLPYLSFTELER